MPLSKSAQEELAKEAQSLLEEVEKHRAAMEKAQAALDAINHLIGGRRKHSGIAGDPHTISFEGIGFREVVRQIFLDFSAGTRPKDMAQYLRELGYVPGGNTDLTTRVGNELNRLKKKGEAKKVGKLYFPTPALEKQS